MHIGPGPIRLVRRGIDAAVVALVGLVLLGVFLGRGLPLVGRPTLIVAGPSMEPSLPIGSAAMIEPIPVGGPVVGDVVEIRVGPTSALFTHRVTRRLELDGVPYIETKGDANPAPDPATVPVSSVVGRVAWSIPYAGYLLALLSIPAGVIFVIGLGLSLIVLADLLETLELRDRAPVPLSTRSAASGPDPLRLEGRIARHRAARVSRARGRGSA